MNEIKLLAELKLLEGTSSIKALADLTVGLPSGDLTIRGLRVIHQPSKEAWVAFPQSSYVKDGKQINKDILILSRSLRKEVCDLVLTEYERSTRV